jgi:hypothetical protein
LIKNNLDYLLFFFVKKIKIMTTFSPIQPRPILSKTPTNNLQSSPIFFVQPSTVINTDLNLNNSSQTSTSLTPYEEFLKRLREFHRCRQ